MIDDCAQLVKANSISGKISFMKMLKSVKCSTGVIHVFRCINQYSSILPFVNYFMIQNVRDFDNSTITWI